MFFKVKDIAAAQPALDRLCEFLASEEVPAETVFDSRLVAYELLANVLKHAKSETGIHGRITDGFIELKVFSNHYFEVPKNVVCSDVYAENGRGLFLVNELCEERIFSEADGIRVLLRIKETV